ncbi:hypothetical protein S140_167 [Shewanella sp. phage 1/40]|uniref:hypothetical protein n=1 Tax=Shewanella sp. phage 1/40 TaxID=1458860 RepID=UPI0004F5CC98|nr:hypothetical protein S140_167 [Shewanella sp. phage 1/40]AHK11574.1 hypothetical protein S140_167 [Shewanella sp. phage 1/40]
MIDMRVGAGIGGAYPVNSIRPFFSRDDVITEDNGAMWLMTGVVDTNISSYPEATVSDYIRDTGTDTTLTSQKFMVRLGNFLWVVLTTSPQVIREYDALTLVSTGRVITLTNDIRLLGCSNEGQVTHYLAVQEVTVAGTTSVVRVYNTTTLAEVANKSYNNAGIRMLIQPDTNSTKTWVEFGGSIYLDNILYTGYSTQFANNTLLVVGDTLYKVGIVFGTSGQLSRYIIEKYSIDRVGNTLTLLQTSPVPPQTLYLTGNTTYLYNALVEGQTIAKVFDLVNVVGLAEKQRLLNSRTTSSQYATPTENANYYVRII